MTAIVLALFLVQDPVLDRLISDFGADQVEVRDQAAKLLAAMGESAELELRRRMPSFSEEAKGRAMDVLRRIAADRDRRKYFPPVRRVSFDTRDRALGDVATEIGLPIEGPRTLKVTLALSDVSPLQAIDALAAAVGHQWAPPPSLCPWEWTDAHPRFQPLYVLKKGVEAATPRQYAGRYRISVRSFTMGASDGSIAKTLPVLDLTYRWPMDVHPDNVTSRFSSVTDDEGQDLLQRVDIRGRPVALTGTQSIDGALKSETTGGCVLKAPPPTATRVTIRGRLILRFPNPRQILSFEVPEQARGQKRESRGVTLTLTGFEWDGTKGSVNMESLGRWERDPHPDDPLFEVRPAIPYLDVIRLRAEDGTLLGQGCGSMSPPGTRAERKAFSRWLIWKEFSSTKPVKIAAVEVITVPDWIYDSVDFELKDVPLPR